MNVEEIDNKIEELQEEIEKLESLRERKESFRRWMADYDETYYCISSCGYVTDFRENDCSIDNFRYETGNYFKTENEAVEYKDKLIIYQKLKDLALELNQGKQIDFDNEKQKKYIIVLDINRGLMIANIVHQQSLGQIYCLDENFLEKAKEKIGEDNLEKRFE